MPDPPSLDDMHQPILIEMDEPTWAAYLDSTEQWLDNVVMVQAAFREQAEDVHGKLSEPHLKDLVARIAQTARDHEQRLDELYGMIGRDPSRARRTIGTLTGKLKALQADLMGLAGGASAPWRDMHQLFLSGANALAAFASAEQLGYSLGMPAFAERCFAITGEKHTHQIVLQELLLELVPWATLYKTSF